MIRIRGEGEGRRATGSSRRQQLVCLVTPVLALLPLPLPLLPAETCGERWWTLMREMDRQHPTGGGQLCAV